MTAKPGYFILLGAALVIGLLSGWLFGTNNTRRDLQAQAIKGGHAVWRVTDEHGNTVFEWTAIHPGEKIVAPEKK